MGISSNTTIASGAMYSGNLFRICLFSSASLAATPPTAYPTNLFPTLRSSIAITTLLLTYFYRHMPEIIEKGYLYICQPPLYRVSTGKVTRYAHTENERDQAVKELSREGRTKNISVQRFKGLGEMNPEQLWQTTMNPETRTLLRVQIDDAAEADEVFSTLMGERVEPRRDFIRGEARKVRNLDI